MFLKKDIFDSTFSKNKAFSIQYDDIEDLRHGIVDLCEILKKDILVIKIFARDPLNEHIKNRCKKTFNYQNFKVYLIENDSLKELMWHIDLGKMRFLDLYALEWQFVSDDLNEMSKAFSFDLGLDNYLEYAKIIIDLEKYDGDIISRLNIH